MLRKSSPASYWFQDGALAMTAVPINRAKPLPSDLAKKLPQNVDAERSVLGAVLLDSGALKAIAESGVVAQDFFLEPHRVILRRMLDLAAHKREIDIITLVDRLARIRDLEL